MEQQLSPEAIAKVRELGGRIRRWRKEEDLSLSEAGERLGCCKAQLSHLERAERMPGLHQAIRIEDEVGINVRAWPEEAKGLTRAKARSGKRK